MNCKSNNTPLEEETQDFPTVYCQGSNSFMAKSYDQTAQNQMAVQRYITPLSNDILPSVQLNHGQKWRPKQFLPGGFYEVKTWKFRALRTVIGFGPFDYYKFWP